MAAEERIYLRITLCIQFAVAHENGAKLPVAALVSTLMIRRLLDQQCDWTLGIRERIPGNAGWKSEYSIDEMQQAALPLQHFSAMTCVQEGGA